MARDEDEGENGRVSYRIQAGNSAGHFALNPNTGKLIFRTRHNMVCLKILGILKIYNRTLIISHKYPRYTVSRDG